MVYRKGEWSPQLRAGRLAWHLAKGEGLTSEQAAQITGLSLRGAQRLLCLLSGRKGLPIYRDDDGVWQLCEIKELDQ